MTKNHFDITSIISYSWDFFKKHWGFLVKLFIVMMLLMLPFTIIDNLWQMSWKETAEFMPVGLAEKKSYFVFAVVMNLFSLYLTYGTMKIYLNLMEGKSAKISDIWNSDFKHYLHFVAGIIAYGVLLLALPVAFVVFAIYTDASFIYLPIFLIPTVYFALKYKFIPTLMVDKKITITKAAEMSARMTEGVKWKIVGFSLILIVLFIAAMIVGLIALIVGIIPAFVIACILFTVADLKLYKVLLEHNHAQS